jgi:drug/metabolite transporter (DMT)-like permease
VSTRMQVPDRSAQSVATSSDGAKAAIAAGVTVVVWASAFVVIRDVGPTLSAAPLALIRLAVAALALTGIVAATKRPTRRVPRSWQSAGLIVAYGVVWLAGYTVALNAGERHIDAGTAALLVNLVPLMIALAAGRLFGEGYPRPLIVGLLVALGGVAVIAMDSSSGGDWVGVVFCVLAAVLFTAGMLIQKVTLHSVDGLTATWLACVAGTLALAPWTPQLIEELRTASAGAVAGAIYLGLFPTAIGFVTWAYALRRTDAGRLSATTYAVPAVSVLMSWLLLAETPTAYGLAGGAICLLGVAISRRRPTPARPLSAAPSLPASGARERPDPPA